MDVTKKTITIALILISFLSGWIIGRKPLSEAKTTPELNLQNENKELHDRVNQLQGQLQGMIQKNKELQMAEESKQLAEQPISARYPKLPDFSIPQDYQKIEIKDAKGSTTITDPAILKSIPNLITIKDEISLGSGPHADLEPVEYLLTTAKGTLKVNIVQQGIVTFDDLYPGRYFEADHSVYQLAKAFMHRPSYIGQEPAIAKMANSGLLKVGEKDVYFIYQAGRFRSVAMAFMNADKRESTKPRNFPDAILNMTFYYYGEQIHMNLFKGKAQIKDNSGEEWFDMNDQDITQILAQLSAG